MIRMRYAINVNWQDAVDDWENEGRRVVEEACTHKDEKDQSDNNIRYKGYCDDCAQTEEILKVLQRTNLTVMYRLLQS